MPHDALAQPVGDALRQCALRVAGKDSRHVQPIDRAAARRRDKPRHVTDRHGDERSAQRGRIETAKDFGDGDDALVLVAVHAG